MKRLLLTLSFVLCPLSFVLSPVSAQVRPNARYNAYISTYAPIAVDQMERYGIPASITLAQGLLESAAGYSELARKGNNHFGIKCHDWTGAKQYHDDDERGECFRVYNTAAESYEDHSIFLSTRPRYKTLFSYPRTDYKNWAHGLKAAGYATNPKYAQQLIDIIELYGLDQYDRAQTAKAANGKLQTGANAPADGYAARGIGDRIRVNNGCSYLLAQPGDTYRSLSKELRIPVSKLASYNDQTKNTPLNPGDIVYLQKKKTKAAKVYKGQVYKIQADDTLHGISQRYGIRLKNLYKLNPQVATQGLIVGDFLRLY